MAFEQVKSLIAGAIPVAAPLDNSKFTAGGDISAGAVVEVDDGVATVIGAGTAFGVALNDATTGEVVRVAIITPGSVYKVQVPAGTLTVGQLDAVVTADGLSAEEGETGGYISVMNVRDDNYDETVQHAFVVFNKCAVSM